MLVFSLSTNNFSSTHTMSRKENLAGYVIGFVLLALGSTGWLTFESVVLADYDRMDSWPRCYCLFFDNDTTVVEDYPGSFSHVTIYTLGKCQTDKDLVPVVVTWPPGSPLYSPKSSDSLRIYLSTIRDAEKQTCYVNPKPIDPSSSSGNSARAAVTENITITGHIVSIVFSLLFALPSVGVLVVVGIMWLCDRQR